VVDAQGDAVRRQRSACAIASAGAALLALAVGARASVEDRWGAASGPAGDPGRTLEVNGIPFQVRVSHSADAPASVRRQAMARFADARHGYDALRDHLRDSGQPTDGALNVLGFGDDAQGGLAALDFGAALTPDGFLARLGRFVESGDLGALGQLRYVYYQRDPGGGTQVVTVTGARGLPIDRLRPGAGGDAAGDELAHVTRPPGAVRVLAVGEHGAGPQLRLYRSHGASLTATREAWAHALYANGWTEDALFGRFAAQQGRSGLRVTRKGNDLTLDFSRNGDDVDVVLVELGR
jgi:hypothetical protein